MNDLTKALSGKKTYIVAILAILYLIGAGVEWWPRSDEVMGIFAALGLATLRAGVGKAERNPEVVRRPSPLIGLGLACVIGGTLFLSTGCGTVPKEEQLRQMTTIAELASYTGARFHLIDNPQDRAFFEASKEALDVMLRDGDYDPGAFALALQGLPVDELKDDKGTLIIGAAVILWDSYSSRVFDLDKEQYIRPVIVAVRNGLARALLASPGR